MAFYCYLAKSILHYEVINKSSWSTITHFDSIGLQGPIKAAQDHASAERVIITPILVLCEIKGPCVFEISLRPERRPRR